MSYKKIIILPALFILSTMVYIGCCKCDDVLEFSEYKNFIVRAYGSGGAIIDTGAITTTDTVFLQYTPQVNCVAVQKSSLTFLGNETYACKCVGCGRSGLKHKVVSIKISSDSIYNGVPADMPLNNFFKAQLYFGTSSIAIDSLVNIINSRQVPYAPIIFHTSIKPSNSKRHLFKMEMSFQNGNLLTTRSRRIVWL